MPVRDLVKPVDGRVGGFEWRWGTGNAELEEEVSTMTTEEPGSSRDRSGSIPEDGFSPYQKTVSHHTRR